MSKQSAKSSPFNSRELSEGWIDHPFVEWLSANRQLILWGLVGLFAALILSYRFLSVRTLNAENDFFQAQAAFQQLEQGSEDPSVSAAHLKELTAIMARHPELHAKYDGALAQYLIIQGQIPDAKSFADSTFQRVKPDQLTFYEEYAKTSLLISEGLYAEALQRVLHLQAQLTEQPALASHTLPTYNLVRLAILYQQLGHEQEEFAAWDTLLKRTEENIHAVLTTYQLFKTGQTSLGQYVEERRKALNL